LGKGSSVRSSERIWTVRYCEFWEETSLKLETPEVWRVEGPERIWIVDLGGYMSIGRKIHRKVEVEELKHPKPEYSKRREPLICEETFGCKYQAPRKLNWFF
jgi:hypothetical protein